ncbi:MAG: hypothetical protein IPI19_13105 [Ignavibacteriales bacterium]|nr:hypothetical protein [Ignavibacteriales bacterium]
MLSGKATVHTVFSGDTTYYNSTYWDQYDEEPAAFSRCTGGTIKYIPEDATGLSLKDLPVAGALANSYLVEFVTAKLVLHILLRLLFILQPLMVFKPII